MFGKQKKKKKKKKEKKRKNAHKDVAILKFVEMITLKIIQPTNTVYI